MKNNHAPRDKKETSERENDKKFKAELVQVFYI